MFEFPLRMLATVRLFGRWPGLMISTRSANKKIRMGAARNNLGESGRSREALRERFWESRSPRGYLYLGPLALCEDYEAKSPKCLRTASQYTRQYQRCLSRLWHRCHCRGNTLL